MSLKTNENSGSFLKKKEFLRFQAWLYF